MKKLLLGILCISLFTSCSYTNTKEIECTLVRDKYIKFVDEKSVYMVNTDKGVFSIEDQPLRGNFRSSDWFGELVPNEYYSFKIGGYRSGFLSMYPIIHSKPIKCTPDVDTTTFDYKVKQNEAYLKTINN